MSMRSSFGRRPGCFGLRGFSFSAFFFSGWGGLFSFGGLFIEPL